MNERLLEEASRQPDDLPDTLKPFGVTPEQYQHACEAVETAIGEAKRHGWQRLVTAEQSDPTVSSVEWHDKFSSRLESHAAELHEQLLEVYRLHQACHDARLDIYNALRSGNREEAVSIATAFARPYDRESRSPTS